MRTGRFQPTTSRSSLAMATLAWAGLASCQGAPRSAGGGVVDDLGRRVTLDEPARRVVSLSPATTEVLFAIGAGPLVVGRTQWDVYPPEASRIPSVGDPMPPNLEVILSTRPDLVVFYASEANASAVARLADLGVPAVSIRMDGLESVPRAARLLGTLTGTSLRADALAAAFEAQLDSARASRRGGDAGRDRVVILSWDNPPIVIGRTSFLTEFLELAGAANAFGDIEAPSPTVTIETIAARDPDRFLVIGDGGDPGWAERPEWRTIPAVADRRFVFVEGSEFSWPSFRALDAVRALRAALRVGTPIHPPAPRDTGGPGPRSEPETVATPGHAGPRPTPSF